MKIVTIHRSWGSVALFRGATPRRRKKRKEGEGPRSRQERKEKKKAGVILRIEGS